MSSNVDFDPWCDPDKPRDVTFENVSSAAYRLQGKVIKTPCVPSHMNSLCGVDLYLKCEFLQHTGSFKERGARNTMLCLDAERRKKGVVGASLGNHSQGMSYHGKDLGIPTTVVMPTLAPLMKIQKCKAFGVDVVIQGSNITEAKHIAMTLAKEKGMTYINGYDHPDVIAGAGTVGLEILDQVPGVEAILVPCGGGGLLAGICIAVKHLRPDILVYGVETEKCASMTGSLKAGKVTPYEIKSTLADGLAVGYVGVNSFHNIKKLVNKMVVVTEDWAARAILTTAELEKYVLEGGGAVAIAAVLSGLTPELKDKQVVAVCSGGNIDTTLLSACFDRGLVAQGRMIKFKLNVSTVAGSLSKLCGHLASLNILIKQISQERAWIQGNIFSVRVKIVAETTGPEQVQQLRELLLKNYKEVYFPKENAETNTDPTGGRVG